MIGLKYILDDEPLLTQMVVRLKEQMPDKTPKSIRYVLDQNFNNLYEQGEFPLKFANIKGRSAEFGNLKHAANLYLQRLKEQLDQEEKKKEQQTDKGSI